MVYLVKFDAAFNTKEEAFAFANLIEGIKEKFTVEVRETPEPEFAITRRLDVWESTHDEAKPVPCKLLMTVDFTKGAQEYKVDGVTPDIKSVLPTSVTSKMTDSEVKA